ncbi:hypothetical protein UFOVP388_31 [uncultured Caudovirales phage]|uniref:Uncharacterized protein n=1 Tax=uncultured Caudovirales phage TaxID=2100421 RepID=A0A6J7X0I4_9CAUD|nr:hypothetical protein UFOVP388_31 [uncultured Caudovirales phage]
MEEEKKKQLIQLGLILWIITLTISVLKYIL